MNKSKKIPFVLLKIVISLRKIWQSFINKKEENKEVKNKVEPSKDKKTPDYSSSGLIVIDDMVYQLDNQNNKNEVKVDLVKMEFIPALAKPVTNSDKSVHIKDENERKADEEEKKEFEEHILAINYLALAGLFLFELVCNASIWCIIGL